MMREFKIDRETYNYIAKNVENHRDVVYNYVESLIKAQSGYIVRDYILEHEWIFNWLKVNEEEFYLYYKYETESDGGYDNELLRQTFISQNLYPPSHSVEKNISDNLSSDLEDDNEVISRWDLDIDIPSEKENKYDLVDAKLDRKEELDKWFKSYTLNPIQVGDNYWGVDPDSIAMIRLRLNLYKDLEQYPRNIIDYYGNFSPLMSMGRLKNLYDRLLSEENNRLLIYNSILLKIENAKTINEVKLVRFNFEQTVDKNQLSNLTNKNLTTDNKEDIIKSNKKILDMEWDKFF